MFFKFLWTFFQTLCPNFYHFVFYVKGFMLQFAVRCVLQKRTNKTLNFTSILLYHDFLPKSIVSNRTISTIICSLIATNTTRITFFTFSSFFVVKPIISTIKATIWFISTYFTMFDLTRLTIFIVIVQCKIVFTWITFFLCTTYTVFSTCLTSFSFLIIIVTIFTTMTSKVLIILIGTV